MAEARTEPGEWLVVIEIISIGRRPDRTVAVMVFHLGWFSRSFKQALTLLAQFKFYQPGATRPVIVIDDPRIEQVQAPAVGPRRCQETACTQPDKSSTPVYPFSHLAPTIPGQRIVLLGGHAAGKNNHIE